MVHVSIPLVAEESAEYIFPISSRVHRREQGDVLTPERFPEKIIAALKLRARIYSTQYQCKPIAKAGKVFKREWFRFYGPKELGFETQLPVKFDEVLQSWDCTFKAQEDSDMVAGHVWGRKGADKFLLDRDTERRSFTETLKAIVRMRSKWPVARKILIEDKANGSAVIDTLQKKVGGIIAIEPNGSKIARAEAAAVDAESGNIYLPGPEICPWTNTLLDFLCGFPGPMNDDDVDAYSQAILRMGQGATGIFGFYEALLAKEKEEQPDIFEQILNAR